MQSPSHLIHSIRNNLTSIVCYAELVRLGDKEAQDLLLEELNQRLPESRGN